MPFLSYLQLGSSCTGFPSTFNVLSLLQPCSPGTRLSVSEGNKLWNGHNASTLDKNSNLQHCCRCLSSSCSLQGEGRSRGRGRQSEICHAFIRSFGRSCILSFFRSLQQAKHSCRFPYLILDCSLCPDSPTWSSCQVALTGKCCKETHLSVIYMIINNNLT